MDKIIEEKIVVNYTVNTDKQVKMKNTQINNRQENKQENK